MTYWDAEVRDALVGKAIALVTLDPERTAVTLVLADGSSVKGVTEGDCCSTTWIDDLTVPPDIAGAVITAIEDSGEVPPTPHKHPVDWLDEIRYYGTSIKTNRGEILVDYRNSSNGYYGGSLEWRLR